MKSLRQESNDSNCRYLNYQNRQNLYQQEVERNCIKLFGRNYNHFKLQSLKSERKFLEMAQEIEQQYRTIIFSKPDLVRIEQWVRKLCENCCDKQPLMKNRNKYIKMLSICVLDLKRLEGVFKKMPPSDGEELKMIQNHEIIEIEYLAKNSKRRQKSQRHAKEMYDFNSKQAKMQMDKVKNTTPQIVVSSRTRNQLETFGQNLTPNAREHRRFVSGVLSSHEKSVRNQSKTVNNTIFDATISPINNKSQNGQSSISANYIPEFKTFCRVIAEKKQQKPKRHKFQQAKAYSTQSNEQFREQSYPRSHSLLNIDSGLTTNRNKEATSHFASVQEGLNSGRRSRAERNAHRSISATSNSSFENGYPISSELNTGRSVDQPNRKVQGEKCLNVENKTQKGENRAKNLSPNIIQKQYQQFQRSQIPKIQIGKLGERTHYENSSVTTEASRENQLLDKEIISTLRELDILRAETEKLLKKRDIILKKTLIR